MKVKISLTLSKDLLETIDTMSASYDSRSEFIEITLRQAIARIIRAENNKRDIEIINRHYKEINAEVEDALSYQVFPPEKD
ncbi:MAG: hypothetical protein KF770_23775 [Anaerolineae bacterium]|nr:hypothetical protein [Anaerolineae bacterium]